MAKRRATTRATTSGKKPRMTTAIKTPSTNPDVMDDSTDEELDEENTEPEDLVKVAKDLAVTLERFTAKIDENRASETAFEVFVERHMGLMQKKMEEISAEILENVEKKMQERPTNITVSTQTEISSTDEMVRIEEKNLLKTAIPFVTAALKIIAGDDEDDLEKMVDRFNGNIKKIRNEFRNSYNDIKTKNKVEIQYKKD